MARRSLRFLRFLLLPFACVTAATALALADSSLPPPVRAGAARVIKLPSGLAYIELRVGTGAMPARGDRVRTHYTGTFLDGSKFDSSVDRKEPFEHVFGVGRVIRGWEEGLATMRVGGKRRLILPPALGYGERGAGGGKIPPNSTLVFDVELLAVLPAQDGSPLRP